MLFRSSNPNNVTLGASIQPVFTAMGDRVSTILERHNFTQIDPNRWYPQQDYLNVYNDIYESQNGVMTDLVGIGMEILDQAVFPAEVDNLEKALLAMDGYYRLNNQDEKAGWVVVMNQQRARCISTTPFPQDLEYGILYALVRKFCPKNMSFKVEYEDLAMRQQTKEFDNPCVYLVTWGDNLSQS